MKMKNRFTERCLELAKNSELKNESPVVCVIVKDDEIIGEGIEGVKSNLDITFHAELEAIRAASQYLKSLDLSECILYTTHEPCIMCSYVIRQTNIKEVIFWKETGEIGGHSSQDFPILKTKKIGKWSHLPIVSKQTFDD